MKNKLKSVRRASKSAAASQPKTTQSRARAHSAIAFKGGLTAVLYNPDGTEWTRVHFNASERHLIEAFLKSTGLTLIALLEKAVLSRVARPDQRRAA